MFNRRTALAAAASFGALATTGAHAATDVHQAFEDLLYGSDEDHQRALASLRAHGGVELAPGLIFAMRFSRADELPVRELLAELTGDSAPEDWFDWMLWQEAHPDVVPHPSYAQIKKDLFLRIDPKFDVFLQDEYLARERMKIRLEEITWGGVRKDGIPSLDNPTMIPAARGRLSGGLGPCLRGGHRRRRAGLSAADHGLARDVQRGDRWGAGGPGLLHPCAARASCSKRTVEGSGSTVRLRLVRVPLPVQQADVRPRDPQPLEPVHRASRWSVPLVDSGIELQQRPVVIDPGSAGGRSIPTA